MTLAVETTLLVLNLREAWSYVSESRILTSTWPPVLASLMMALLLFEMRGHFSIFFMVPAGAISYLAVLGAIGPLRAYDRIQARAA